MVLDDTNLSDQQLMSMARFLALPSGTEVELLLVYNNMKRSRFEQLSYLRAISDAFTKAGLTTNFKTTQGDAAPLINRRAITKQADIIVVTTVGNSPVTKYISNNDVEQVIKLTLIPTLVIQKSKMQKKFTHFKRILVALDGSEAAESVLPYIRALARGIGSSVFLLSVPEGSESESYGGTIQLYLENIAKQLKVDGINTTIYMVGSGPARTILAMAEEEKADLIVMASHGRGGIERPTIHMGSVTEKAIQKAPCPLFIVPLTKSDSLG
jgi:nucleotide-binding universal stress UspA family protein